MKLNNYSVADFEKDMKSFTEADIEAYEAGRVYAFPGSYKPTSVFLRENSIANVLDHDDKRYLSNREKTLLKLCMIFAEQDRFDDLYIEAKFPIERIAHAFNTTSSNVTMKIMYDFAKEDFLKKQNKVKSY